jgi:hypothetical protein
MEHLDSVIPTSTSKHIHTGKPVGRREGADSRTKAKLPHPLRETTGYPKYNWMGPHSTKARRGVL